MDEREYTLGYSSIERMPNWYVALELENFGNVPVSFSAGGACCPADGVSYEELCNSADKALYQVKESGKGKFYWYQ